MQTSPLFDNVWLFLCLPFPTCPSPVTNPGFPGKTRKLIVTSTVLCAQSITLTRNAVQTESPIRKKNMIRMLTARGRGPLGGRWENRKAIPSHRLAQPQGWDGLIQQWDHPQPKQMLPGKEKKQPLDLGFQWAANSLVTKWNEPFQLEAFPARRRSTVHGRTQGNEFTHPFSYLLWPAQPFAQPHCPIKGQGKCVPVKQSKANGRPERSRLGFCLNDWIPGPVPADIEVSAPRVLNWFGFDVDFLPCTCIHNPGRARSVSMRGLRLPFLSCSFCPVMWPDLCSLPHPYGICSDTK